VIGFGWVRRRGLIQGRRPDQRRAVASVLVASLGLCGGFAAAALAASRIASPSVRPSAAPKHSSPSVARHPGLIAAYSFDQPTRRVAPDLSGQDNAASLVNVRWTPYGKFSGAVSLTGRRSFLRVGGLSGLDASTGTTFEAWVRPSALGGHRTILAEALGDARSSTKSGCVVVTSKPSSLSRGPVTRRRPPKTLQTRLGTSSQRRRIDRPSGCTSTDASYRACRPTANSL
jgi:hypothetical protein